MTDRMKRALWMTEQLWRRSRVALSMGLFGVVAVAATGTFAVEDSAKLSNVGLAGIFPSTPPDDLKEDQFSKLDGNWAEWSKGAAAAVSEFYSNIDKTDAAGQRRSLSVLKVKQDVMRRALDDSRYKSLHAPLTTLNKSLSLRINFAEAALDTLDVDGPAVAAVKTTSRSNTLISAIQSLESHLASITNGNLWLPYFNVPELRNSLTADPRGSAAVSAASKAQVNLKSRDYVLDDAQRAFTHHPKFETFANAVDQYLLIATWNSPAEANAKLRSELKLLATSLDTFATTGDKAPEVRTAFNRVRLASADAGDRIATTLQTQLFNYNLRVLVTEAFMNRLISDSRTEIGPINDCVLGAKVDGCQVTNTSVRVDLRPSYSTARFDLCLDGSIRSNTQGVTPQATVYTAGNHTFAARKEINFDGARFSTSPATIAVSPHNTTTGIAVKFGRVPILGRIVNNIAAEQVEAKKGQAESITASRVSDGVLPRFNQEVDSSFSTSGNKLEQEVFAGLRSSGLFPDTYSYQTSDQLLTINARLMGPNQVAGNLPASDLMAVSGATVLIHETILNNAIDQIGFAGLTLNEPELRAKIELFLTKALNRPFKFDAPPPVDPADDDSKKLSGVTFAATDPIRIRISNGELMIVIRAAFKQEGREDIPMREISVPISFAVNNGQIVVSRGNVVVVAAADGEGGGIAVNAVVRKKIQSVLPDRTVDGKVEFKAQNKIVVSHVSKLTLADGWVAVAID